MAYIPNAIQESAENTSIGFCTVHVVVSSENADAGVSQQ